VQALKIASIINMTDVQTQTLQHRDEHET
jgi:hypothetical protein